MSPPTPTRTRTSLLPPTAPPSLEKLIAELERSIPAEALPPVSTSKHVASLLGTTENALAQDRYLRKGIPYTRAGRKVRYLRSDVIEFLAVNRVDGPA